MENSISTILVAEDEPNSRFLYQEILTEAGYRVLTVENGSEALAELRDETVDLLITDLKMPDMSALTMLPLLRLQYPKLPVIIVSAYYRLLKDDFHSKGYDVQAFFSKPVPADELLLKIKELLSPSASPKG
jgi:two-component system response regulator AtoC